MSIVRILILGVAFAAAMIAALMVRNISAPAETQTVIVEAPVEEEIEYTKVLIADRDLTLGERLVPEDLKWQEWPEEALNSAFYDDESNADAMGELTGAFVRVEILSGEPITDRKLLKKDSTGFMAAVLGPGMRAVAAEISVETAAGGFILPNDRVDVILTHNVEVQNGDFITEKPISETVLNNVRVLAIDQTFGTVGDGETILPSTATLELNQQDSVTLALAQEMGEISLALRSIADLHEASGVNGDFDVNRKPDIGGTVRVYRSSKPSDQAVGG